MRTDEPGRSGHQPAPVGDVVPRRFGGGHGRSVGWACTGPEGTGSVMGRHTPVARWVDARSNAHGVYTLRVQHDPAPTVGAPGDRVHREEPLVKRAYELMVIFVADLDDAGVTAELDRVGEMVTAAGGSVVSTDLWGKRRFAYEINHQYEGIYVVLEIVTEQALDDVDRYLRLADPTVRHKIVRLPDHEAQRRGLIDETASA